MSSRQRTSDDLRAVVDALRSRDRFLLVTHENPDGDALGSLLAMKLALDSLGKDSEMYLYGDAPLPREYAFMPLAGLRREPPADTAERALVALDCANEQRLGPDPTLLEQAPLTIDIDHHHDNTRFGDLNLIVADASSTAEVLRDILGELGVELTPEIAEALYVALVTDTGRFQYTNTTPKALRLAAELVEAGADIHRVFQALYESIDFIKFKLTGKAAERAQIFEGGRLVISYLERSDFTELGAAEAYAEGVIDSLRAIDGAEMVALIREPPRRDDAPARKVSLRASVDEIDVSAIARKSGGGGHRPAAGFSSDASVEEITRFIHDEFARAASRA
jgi:bifunctional oligoribonuclease and PAP phosphatase NrnA